MLALTFLVFLGVMSSSDAQPIEESIDYYQLTLSEYLIDFTNQIDRFFITDDQEQRMNYSHLHFGYRYVDYQGNNYLLEPVFEARFHLPRVEDFLSVNITNMNNFKSSDDAAAGKTNDPAVEGPLDQGVKLAIGYARDVSDAFAVKATSGAHWVNDGLNPFVNLRLENVFLFDPWALTLSEDLYHDSIIHSRATTQIHFERKMGEDMVFQSNSKNIYYYDLGYTQMHQTFSVLHQLSERDAFIYQAGGMWEKPLDVVDFQLENYYTLVRYSRKLHKNWLFLEVSPQVHFPRTADFEPEPLLMLQLTAFIGNNG